MLYSNCENVSKIIDLRIQSAQLLGYRTYADYALEVRMAKDAGTVNKFLADLMNPSLPYARADVKMVEDFARKNGFEGDRLMGWDFSYWSEKLQKAEYDLSEELLKPYFKLENCIDAVFDLAHRLYGINFKIREDIPGYHKDVKVYEVTDEDGSHLAATLIKRTHNIGFHSAVNCRNVILFIFCMGNIRFFAAYN